ncbi:MAG: hypothetical protein LBV49_10795, partial [Azonexus sp.]|nr:hypothetical protein [Azonexus sp.]
MEREIDPGLAKRFWRTPSLLALAALLVAGCAQAPAPVDNEPTPARSDLPGETHGVLSPLAYYQTLERMNASQLARERGALAALPGSPAVQLRQAMVIGHPHGQADAARALALVEQALRASDPAAQELR